MGAGDAINPSGLPELKEKLSAFAGTATPSRLPIQIAEMKKRDLCAPPNTHLKH
jgi:hypothetical protein